jgi:hypothetical protein
VDYQQKRTAPGNEFGQTSQKVFLPPEISSRPLDIIEAVAFAKKAAAG